MNVNAEIRNQMKAKAYRKGSVILAKDVKKMIRDSNLPIKDVNKSVQTALNNLMRRGLIQKTNPLVQDGIYKALSNSKTW